MPNRREYSPDPTIAIMAAMQGLQASIWTALPCRVEAFDPVKMTVSAAPLIRAKVTHEDGTFDWVALPLLVDVPVVFPSAGGFTLTFPVQAGDEALVVFSSRCIDAWWDTGATGNQPDLRMHDLSDGFAIIGPRSRPNAIPNISLEAVELRNNARTAYVRIHNTADVIVKTPGTALVEAGSQVTITAPLVQINGNVNVTGSITASGDVTGVGTSLDTHVHGGVQPGGGNTGQPV